MFNLTRKQQVLVSIAVGLFLTGLAVKYWRAKDLPPSISRVESSASNASR
jgi:hypothetical protein